MNTVEDCRLLELPKICDPRGNLTPFEGGVNLPFEIRRVFYIYDIPTGESRGAHSHWTLHQFLVCLSGGYDVELDDGTARRTVRLNRPWQGLYVPPLIWASETNFDPNSIVLVCASDFFNEEDYIRDYDVFLRSRGVAP